MQISSFCFFFVCVLLAMPLAANLLQHVPADWKNTHLTQGE